jgi:hypothetical protein
MTNIYEEFGKNAGDIWKTLNTYGPQTETRLKENTKLHDHAFYSALGWLARENKICKDGPVYKLGETNLTTKIGADAGKVWTILEAKGNLDVWEASTALHMDEKDIYSAIGWLARENKIEAKPTPVPREYQTKNK